MEAHLDENQRAAANLPLAGIRVLDFSQVMAGPYCCMLLGDIGADVIKVEPPGAGDQARKSMEYRLKGDDSPGFLALNRNKRSIALNLKEDAGREVFELVRTADVVVENWRPGVATAEDRLSDDGRDQSATGLCQHLRLRPDRSVGRPAGLRSDRAGDVRRNQRHRTARPEPVKSGVPFADLGAGLFALYGILSALIGRQHSGRGSTLTLRCSRRRSAFPSGRRPNIWATGKPPRPLGTANRMSAPYQAVKAKDGYFVFGAANQKLWIRLCEMIGRDDLLNDARFLTNSSRMKHREVLIGKLSSEFAKGTVHEWVEKLLGAGVPAARSTTMRRRWAATIPRPARCSCRSPTRRKAT